jgi:hypothetical protein
MPYIINEHICLSRIEDNVSKGVFAVSFSILKSAFIRLNPLASTGSRL